ncbi:ABC transporter permease [Acrocarpospora catenulata]|uniref:ABC transporter permease n=1 Tax=Acrocarpospora catenulata TaxID=2836182 RepID=UPI001BD98092|nr:ABC transporter permease [Acrocarpospora catenulata]
MRPSKFTIAFGILLAIFLVAPTIIVTVTSFSAGEIIQFPLKEASLRWYEEILTDRGWLQAFGNSLLVGLFAALLAAVFGVSIAFMAARGTAVPRRLIVNAGIGPILIPVVVIAIGIYMVFSRLGLGGDVPSLAIAHSVIGIPFVFINSLAAFAALEENVEDAALACGASRAVTLFRIVLPQIAPSVLVGSLLAFGSSWDEVIVAQFLNTPGFRTIPVVIWGQMREGIQPSTAAVGTLLTLISMVVFIVIALVNLNRGRRRQGVA